MSDYVIRNNFIEEKKNISVAEVTKSFLNLRNSYSDMMNVISLIKYDNNFVIT